MNKEQLSKAFWTIVKQQLGGSRTKGWGQADSESCIDALIAEDYEAIGKGKGAGADLMFFIGLLVNPSAFRQRLESEKINLLDKSEGKKAKLDGWMAGLKAD